MLTSPWPRTFSAPWPKYKLGISTWRSCRNLLTFSMIILLLANPMSMLHLSYWQLQSSSNMGQGPACQLWPWYFLFLTEMPSLFLPLVVQRCGFSTLSPKSIRIQYSSLECPGPGPSHTSYICSRPTALYHHTSHALDTPPPRAPGS